ncbi:hypothetical protein AMECASPLE_025129 [Ameca splendens]|uniref:Uncharacterized protein n=1 Tax=Ameca splendens TaxID=208324 RepID=A0ABV0YGA8_9TELE
MRTIVGYAIILGLFQYFFKRRQEAKGDFHPIGQKNLGSFWVNFFLLEKQYEKTPKGEEELPLMLAGLGKHSLTKSENMTHSEVCYNSFSALCQVMSKEKNIHLRIHLHA